MCRALQVVCVAAEPESLRVLKRASVSTGWELTPGATSDAEALAQIEDHRAHVVVTWGPFADLVAEARRRFPGLRIVAVEPPGGAVPGADVVVRDVRAVRDAILGSPSVGGPVTA